MNYTPYYYQQQYQPPMQDQLTQLRGMQQPLQMQPMQPPQQSGGIIWVGSEQEVYGYPVAPNSAVVLWNSNAPVVYLKQTDASGRPTVKTYDLVERTVATFAPSEQPKAEYVTFDAFNALVARVEALAAPKTTKKTKDKEESENE